MNDTNSLQDTYGPNLVCFGCGPGNEKGLRIKSFADGDEVTAEWTPLDHHEAFPGVLNGGIIGTLLDCHMNWTALWALLQRDGGDPQQTVTAEFAVKLLRPTPSDSRVRLVARAVELEGSKVKVEAELYSAKHDKLCASGSGTFVAVTEGHPAFHPW